MKEPKFLDTYGYENQNTFVQYDQLEQRKARTLKVRSIFDLSLPMFVKTDGPYAENADLTDTSYGADRVYLARYGWKNITYDNTRTWTVANGFSKDIEIIKENHYVTYPVGGGGSEVANGYPNFSYVNGPCNDERLAPYFDGDTTLYLESTTKGSLTSPGGNLIKFFRSGYLELSFKTNKQNCILAFGSGTFIGEGYASEVKDQIFDDSIVAIDSSNAFTQESASENKEIFLEIKDGKLYFKYADEFSENSESFEIHGTKNVADDQWHHVVFNVGRPGTLRNFGKKHSKRYIEMWVDGSLDFRTFEYVNDKQIFFPTFTWIGSNAKQLFSNDSVDAWKNEDMLTGVGPWVENATVGYSSPFATYNNIERAKFNQNAKQNIFVGAINHIVTGLNFSLSKQEIQQRNRLFRGYDKEEAEVFTASALMVNPAVSTNKKKALKLFWNNLISENAKNGIELDSNFDVHSYSVTHKTSNSPTEINNLDLSKTGVINALADVRVALTENVLYWAPGSIVDQQYPEKFLLLSAGLQWNGENLKPYDAFSIDSNTGTHDYNSKFLTAYIRDLHFSGVQLKSGDRILLTNQASPKHNGVWVYSDVDSGLVRADDSDSFEKIKDAVVYVTDGYYNGSTWKIDNKPTSLTRGQFWSQLEYYPEADNINSQPIFSGRWSVNAEESFIDLEQHLDINEYDLIVFMNYPETNEQIKEYFAEYDDFEVQVKYQNFIKSLQNVVANGASLFVSSPRLAQDLKIIADYHMMEQELETTDAQSAAISPFESSEPADQYFDTHRISQYKLVTEVPGLTDKETYILTDFINYAPTNPNENEQYHAKYSYRQLGLKEGNEFYVPSLALRKSATNASLPGYRNNAKTSKAIPVIEPWHVLAGTPVTQWQTNYYAGSSSIVNPHNDDITTLIVHNGQLLDGQTVTGKIFVNFVEDGYTMSREEYNKATIQVIPDGVIEESTATRAWQYSTTRLNRLPKRINVSGITKFGQTTPTNGGGGPFIQAQTNSSNGIIRSNTDLGKVDYQSDLYATETEEIYPIQEIPVLSMTWLGLQWLAE